MDLPPAGASHDEREIEAVLRVLKENPTLDLGNEVLNLETRIADLLAKSHGVMVNSGSSALRLAIDLLRAIDTVRDAFRRARGRDMRDVRDGLYNPKSYILRSPQRSSFVNTHA